MNFSELGNLPGLPKQPKGIVKLFNKVIRKLGFNYELTPLPNGRVHMHTVEQRINFSLLAMCNLVYNVPGEWAEFGCYNGQSAIVFQKVLDKYKPGSKIMLYDSFTAKYALNEDIKQNLLSNVKKQGLAEPLLNPVGDILYTTIPKGADFVIYNSTGQVIEYYEKSFLEDKLVVHTSSFVNGMYFIQVKTPKGIIVKKFVK